MLLEHRTIAPRLPSERPPMLLLLHGIGADETDLLPLARELDPRLLVLAVRAPHEAEPMGYRWYAIDWSVSPPRADPAEIAASRDRLGDFVDEATARYGADPSRVFLFGFSQGAILSVALLLSRPDRIRGVVAHSGRLVRLPGQADLTPAALAHVDALVLHGVLDDVVPVSDGRKIAVVLEKLLGDRLVYREYGDLAHGISARSVADAARWLTARLDASGRPESRPRL